MDFVCLWWTWKYPLFIEKLQDMNFASAHSATISTWKSKIYSLKWISKLEWFRSRSLPAALSYKLNGSVNNTKYVEINSTIIANTSTQIYVLYTHSL